MRKKSLLPIVIAVISLSLLILLSAFLFIPYVNRNEVRHNEVWYVETISPITLGSGYSLIIQQDDSLWLWHDSYFDDEVSDLIPSAIVKIMDDVRSTHIGMTGTAITNDGVLWDLAGGFYYDNFFPFILTPNHVNPTQLAVGAAAASTYAIESRIIKEDGSLWLMETITGRENVEFGEPIRFMESVRPCSIDSLPIKEDGSLWRWDWDFGYDGLTVIRSEPENILNGVRSASVGWGHHMAITDDETLWGWGRNSYGQIGNGTTIDQDIPIEIMTNVIQVSAGDNVTMAIKEDNSLWAWGDNERGQLGDGTRINRTEPVHIMNDALYVVAGSAFDLYPSLAIRTDGSLWAWGVNGLGEVGDGVRLRRQDLTSDRSLDRLRPVRIMENVVYVAANNHTNIAVQSDGTLWAWGGFRTLLNLSHGTEETIRSVPVKIMENVRLTIHEADI